MIGCSFVANRDYFGELGLLDPGMDVYGGENIELGIRVCFDIQFCFPSSVHSPPPAPHATSGAMTQRCGGRP